MKLRYILVTMMILLIPLLAFGLDIDEDSNDAVDIAYGGTNAITAAAARTSLGVGTTDSPQFTGIELGHATENTLSASGGVLSIEGVALETDTHASEHTIGGADVIDRLFNGATEATITTTGAGADTDGIVVNMGLYNCTGLTIAFDDFVDGVDGDHSGFSPGNYFGIYMNASTASVDFSANANIEGNAGTDFTGSTSEIVFLIFQFRGTGWVCINYNMGFSDPTTFASKLVTNPNKYTGNDTMTAAEAYNYVHFITGAAEIEMPALVSGMGFCVENHTDGDVYFDPNGTDAIKLNGAAQLADGLRIIGTDVGDGCTFKFFEAGVWSAWCNGYEGIAD